MKKFKNQTFALFVAAIIGILVFLIFKNARSKSELVQTDANSYGREFIVEGVKENDPRYWTKERQQKIIDEHLKKREGKRILLHAILNNSIEFYGQVLDQNDDPVVGARIEYSALDAAAFTKAWDEGVPKKTIHSKSNGKFFIQGKGGSLNIYVSHPDYYEIEGKSSDSFSYGMPSGSKPATDSVSPAIFRLQKKGKIEPLIHSGISYKRHRFRGNTDTMIIDLTTGKPISRLRAGNQKKLLLDYWQSHNEKNPEELQWKLTLSLGEEGGFAEREKEFDFIAPEKGYLGQLILTSEQSLNTDGISHRRHGIVNKHYFVKFGDRVYGRIVIDLQAGGEKPRVSVISWINPSGSRNLEYDKSKRVN